MTDLKPLRESSRDGFAKGLLHSSFLDEPPRHSLRRTAAFLGVGEAAAATLTASTAIGAAPEVLGASTALGGSGGAALSASAASGSKAALLAVLKWLGAGAIVGASTAGGLHYLTDHGAPPAPAVTAQQSAANRSATTSVEPGSKSVQPPPAPTAGEEELRAARPELRTRTRNSAVKARALADTAPTAATESTVDTPALDGEIRRLDRARAALARGSSENALAELAAYESERKTTVLEREAMVLRIDAMLGQGDREGARILARRYLAAHPGDPHALRLRKLLEPEGEP